MTGPLDAFVVSSSGLPEDDRRLVERRVHELGGVYSGDLTTLVTHLISATTTSKKYQVAVGIGIPVISPQWISCLEAPDGDIEPFKNYLLPPFKGMLVCVSGYPTYIRREIEQRVMELGGAFTYNLSKDCTHLVCDAPTGNKYRFALEWKIHVVTIEWLNECCRLHGRIGESKYPVGGTPHASASVMASSGEPRFTASIETGTSGASGMNAPHINGAGYLERCNIYLGDGFDAPVLEFVRKIVREGCGTMMRACDGFVTHYVLSGLSPLESDLDRLRALPKPVLIVSYKWLSACYNHKAIQPVDPFLVDLDRPVDPHAGKTASQIQKQTLFGGRLFEIRGFNNFQHRKMRGYILDHGGKVSFSGPPDLILVKFTGRDAAHVNIASEEFDRCVTEYWLEACIDTITFIEPTSNVLYQPSMHTFPVRGASADTRICITGYEHTERLHLSRAIGLVGAVFCEALDKSCRVLVCHPTLGVGSAKYRKAKEWKIRVVNGEWLLACLQEGRYVDYSSYTLPKDMMHQQQGAGQLRGKARDDRTLHLEMNGVLSTLRASANAAGSAVGDIRRQARAHGDSDDENGTAAVLGRNLGDALKIAADRRRQGQRGHLSNARNDDGHNSPHRYVAGDDDVHEDHNNPFVVRGAKSAFKRAEASENASNSSSPHAHDDDETRLSDAASGEDDQENEAMRAGLDLLEQRPRSTFKRSVFKADATNASKPSAPVKVAGATEISVSVPPAAAAGTSAGAGQHVGLLSASKRKSTSMSMIMNMRAASINGSSLAGGNHLANGDNSAAAGASVGASSVPGADYVGYKDPDGQNEKRMLLEQLGQSSKRQRTSDAHNATRNSIQQQPKRSGQSESASNLSRCDLEHISAEIVDLTADRSTSSSRQHAASNSRLSNTMLRQSSPHRSSRSSSLQQRQKLPQVRREFLFSGFQPDQKKQLAATITNLGGIVSSHDGWHEGVTHLIAAAPGRSEKFLAALASGSWILKPSFISASAKSNEFVSEEEHEWNASDGEYAAAARRWRTAVKVDGQRGSFSGWRVLLLVDEAKLDGFRKVLEAGGAEVVLASPSLRGVSEAGTFTHALLDSTRFGSLSKLTKIGIPAYETQALVHMLFSTSPSIEKFRLRR